MAELNECDVVVVGGGAAGTAAATLLARSCRDVVLVDAGRPRNAPAQHLHGFLSRDGESPQQLLDSGRAELAGYGGRLVEDRVEEAAADPDGGFRIGLGGAVVPRSAVFVGPRFLPNDALLTGLGCGRGEDGWVVTGASGATDVPGVWAAGNVVDSPAQLINAASAGSTAAIAINHHLLAEDVDRAVRDGSAGAVVS